MERVDGVIVGAGVVGLAVAEALSREKQGSILILEAGPRIAEGVTSRNSGVIHSPINYPPGTLKGALCMEGRERLYAWCQQNDVPHRQCGKLIVATDDAEVAELQELLEQAHAHGARETHLISRAEVMAVIPENRGIAALYSPRTGIIDPAALSQSLLMKSEENGAMLVANAKVERIEMTGGSWTLGTTRGEIQADWVVNSAGLHSDEIAKMAGIGQYTIYPWRGDYFELRLGIPVDVLVYPVKAKGAAGLGVHLTVDLSGKIRLGPDVELSPNKVEFGPKEEKLAKFAAAARKLFPWITDEMLKYDTCGIRPKIRSPQDTQEKDFVISRDLPGFINLIGIESPGLTSALAIAERVAALL
jgi:L-2-hydroxyglutarate oxidase LhgO